MSTNCNFAKIVVAAVGLAFAASAVAQDAGAPTSRKEYRHAMASARADYKSALKACPAAKGPDRDSCRHQARATRDAAFADARGKHGMPATTNPAYPQQSKTPN
jgi:hypothetical protein